MKERLELSIINSRLFAKAGLSTVLAALVLWTSCQPPKTSSERLPPLPDYADQLQWYVAERLAGADIFYVTSTETADYVLSDGTTCHYADTYKDSLRVPVRREMIGVDTLLSGRLNFYSPYYRQCSLQSFESDSLKNARIALALSDVRRAFSYYLRFYNGGRPFILVGYSQGAHIILQLVREMDDETFARMIAAYAIGVTTDKPHPRIVAAKSADDLGVTICYNSVRDTSCAMPGWEHSTVAINPVNWRTDGQPATLVTEPSPLVPVAEQKKDTMSVRLDVASGLLIVEGFTAQDYVLPLLGREGNYHTREIWLYRDQLRENISHRVERWGGISCVPLVASGKAERTSKIPYIQNLTSKIPYIRNFLRPVGSKRQSRADKQIPYGGCFSTKDSQLSTP